MSTYGIAPLWSANADTVDITKNPLYVTTDAPHISPDVVISIDKTSPLVYSNLMFGVTHTHYHWQNGNADAVARAKGLLKTFEFHNQHMMSWGAPAIKTDSNGVPTNLNDPYGLQRYVGRSTALGDGIITFCTAPGWMKPSGSGNPEDPTGNGATSEAPLPEYEEAFATLCAEVAANFPEVKYFQVWNEMKGLYDADALSLNPGRIKGRWDYERYTSLYNKVYQAVKEVRPDAQIGGFYQVITNSGTGPILGLSTSGVYEQNTQTPFDNDTERGIEYFLDNANGLDMFLCDTSLVSTNNPYRGTLTDLQVMQLTQNYGTITEKFVDKLNENNLDVPLVFSEYYGSVNGNVGALKSDIGTPSNDIPLEQYAACQFASIYNHVISSSSGHEVWMLLWLDVPEKIPFNCLFTDTNTADGGEPTAHYWVIKTYTDWFAKTQLLTTTSSSSNVEVIASSEAALVINKRNIPVTVNINGKGLSLEAYGIALIDNKSVLHEPIDNNSISYVLDGGVNGAGNPPSYAMGDLPLSVVDPVRVGYDFKYWIVTYDNGIQRFLPASGIPAGTVGDIVLTAVWSDAIRYTVTYDLQGGVNVPTNPVWYSVKNFFPVGIAAPSKTGYVFDYWRAEFANGTIVALPASGYSCWYYW